MTHSPRSIPEGFPSITPYLVVPEAASLLDFLKSAFHAEELVRAAGDSGAITHAAVKLGDSMLEMADVGGPEQQPLTAGLHYYVRDVTAVYQRAIAHGATSLYPPREMPYGDREGSVEDPGGNHWYIATRKEGTYRPEGYRDLNPSVTVRDAARFLRFLEDAFVATVRGKHSDKSGTILYAAVDIGDTVLEFGEAHDAFSARPTAFQYDSENGDAAFSRALSAGATTLAFLEDQAHGDRIGAIIDAWGNRWYRATRREHRS